MFRPCLNIRMIIILAATLLSGCSKAGTKEFFFGNQNGPDPFVIGSTLSPLKKTPVFHNSELPKPKPILPPSQMPSHAKKAYEILGIASMPQTNDSETTGTIETKNDKIIDFTKFDSMMTQEYNQQKQRGYLLTTILGEKDTIDPSIRDKQKEQKND